MTSSGAAEAPLMLSVSGARGIVGRTMTHAVAADFAAAFGSYIRASTGSDQPLLCVGRDSRPSGEELEAAVMDSLAAVGARVIDLGIIATPTVGVMIGRHGADGGMVVTASHNPAQWNGLKCLNSDGVAPPPADASEIIRRFKARDFLAASSRQPITRDDTANEVHVEKVLANIDAEAIRSADFGTIVLDSVNGAGCASGRLLLSRLGCTIEHLGGVPNGEFAHPPEPTEANLAELAARSGSLRSIGFAQDPDADRLAITDDRGRYIGEEYTLALAALRALELARDSELRTQNSELILAANLSTSRMIDDIAAMFPGARVLRTAVGEANVVAALKSANGLIGGEGNGGVIYPPVCWVRDSLSAMALVLSLLASRRLRLSEVVATLPCYVMIKEKFELGAGIAAAEIAQRLKKVSDTFSASGAGAMVNTIDGVRLDFPDGWVHLRSSNTEPIVRLIAEAKSDSRARELVNAVAAAAGLA
jgi:phosphomannomutase